MKWKHTKLPKIIHLKGRMISTGEWGVAVTEERTLATSAITLGSLVKQRMAQPQQNNPYVLLQPWMAPNLWFCFGFFIHLSRIEILGKSMKKQGSFISKGLRETPFPVPCTLLSIYVSVVCKYVKGISYSQLVISLNPNVIKFNFF